jgi:hypothetical protein
MSASDSIPFKLFLSKRTLEQETLFERVWAHCANEPNSQLVIYADVFLRLLLCFRCQDDSAARSIMLDGDMYKLPRHELLNVFDAFLNAIPRAEAASSFAELPSLPVLRAVGIEEAMFWKQVACFATPFGFLGSEASLLCSFSEYGITLVANGTLPSGFKVPGALAHLAVSQDVADKLDTPAGRSLYGISAYLLKKNECFYLTCGPLALLNEACALHFNVVANNWDPCGKSVLSVLCGTEITTRYHTPEQSEQPRLPCVECVQLAKWKRRPPSDNKNRWAVGTDLSSPLLSVSALYSECIMLK